MRIKDLLKAMFHGYFVITTGITISMFVSCLLFKPNVTLSPVDIGGILLMAFVGDFTFLIFYSQKELSRKQMLLRFSLHIPMVLAILLLFAHVFHWVNMKNPKEVIVFILLVLGVYAGVLGIAFCRDKKIADQLNNSLKQRYHS